MVNVFTMPGRPLLIHMTVYMQKWFELHYTLIYNAFVKSTSCLLVCYRKWLLIDFAIEHNFYSETDVSTVKPKTAKDLD